MCRKLCFYHFIQLFLPSFYLTQEPNSTGSFINYQVDSNSEIPVDSYCNMVANASRNEEAPMTSSY